MPGPLGRMTFRGQMPSGEVFQYAIYWVREDATDMTIAELAAAADQWQTTVSTGSTPLVSQYSNQTVWQTVQADIIDVATSKSSERAYGTVAIAGTVSATFATLPPQVAVCVTLRSNTAGPGGRGRFYLPAPTSGALSSVGRLAPAALNAIAGSLANGMTAMAGRTNPLQPAVYSRARHLYEPVTRGDVGDVLDTQRPRRDKLVEARESILG